MDYIKSFIDLIYLYESPITDISLVFGIFVVIYSLMLLALLPFTRKKKKDIEEEKEKAEQITADAEEYAAEEETTDTAFKAPTGQEAAEAQEIKEPPEETEPPGKTETAFKAPVREVEEDIPPVRVDVEETPEKIEHEITEELIPEIEEEIEDVVVPEKEIEEETDEVSFFSRLRSGLSKTQEGLLGKLGSVFSGGSIDDSSWDEFEEILIMSDIGVPTTMKLRDKIEGKVSKNSSADFNVIKDTLKEEVLEILKNAESGELNLNNKPSVVMIAGVNGVGKTTSIGKISNLYVNQGNKVMIAAADTFRAAAVEQLEIWANRVGSDFLKGQTGADPSAVAFDAVQASKSRNIDILIIDTAGRLHTKSNLMDELKKLKRVVGRELEGAPHETLLVLDATTGQNAVQQAKLFNEAIDITGIILTKLDGTAKGGVIIAIADELNIPVKYIGVGEGLNDLREFDAEEFVEALFLPDSEKH